MSDCCGDGLLPSSEPAGRYDGTHDVAGRISRPNPLATASDLRPPCRCSLTHSRGRFLSERMRTGRRRNYSLLKAPFRDGASLRPSGRGDPSKRSSPSCVQHGTAGAGQRRP